MLLTCTNSNGEGFEEVILARYTQKEVHAAIRDVHLTWSTLGFKAGWVALSDHYAATPIIWRMPNENILINGKGWHVGDSDPVSRVAHRQSQELFV